MTKEAMKRVDSDKFIWRLATSTATGQHHADILSETHFETGDSKKRNRIPKLPRKRK